MGNSIEYLFSVMIFSCFIRRYLLGKLCVSPPLLKLLLELGKILRREEILLFDALFLLLFLGFLGRLLLGLYSLAELLAWVTVT